MISHFIGKVDLIPGRRRPWDHVLLPFGPDDEEARQSLGALGSQLTKLVYVW